MRQLNGASVARRRLRLFVEGLLSDSARGCFGSKAVRRARAPRWLAVERSCRVLHVAFPSLCNMQQTLLRCCVAPLRPRRCAADSVLSLPAGTLD